MEKRIAIQGYRGCFHEEAARLFYRGDEAFRSVECPTFDSLFQALEEGRADAAVMAVENTISGGLLPNFDLLRRYGVPVRGEVYLQIQQNLMALPGQRLEDIHTVRTHYMAINQTRLFFEKTMPWVTVVESEDTAGSAADLSRSGEKGVGAVASELAAELYGLEILAEGIETYKDNFTRFLILDRHLEVAEAEIDKATLCFTLPHSPGSLAQILTILSFYGMNLTRIQSLPIPGRSWQYFFYIDLRFDEVGRYRQALAAVRPLLEDLTILGEYKAAL